MGYENDTFFILPELCLPHSLSMPWKYLMKHHVVSEVKPITRSRSASNTHDDGASFSRALVGHELPLNPHPAISPWLNNQFRHAGLKTGVATDLIAWPPCTSGAWDWNSDWKAWKILQPLRVLVPNLVAGVGRQVLWDARRVGEGDAVPPRPAVMRVLD